MDPEQQQHALLLQEQVSKALHARMAESDRSEWSASHKIGVSDIGHCREYLRRIIMAEPFSDEQDDYSAAFMGTAIGALAEEAMERAFPGDRTQLSVTVNLQIGDYLLQIPGHPDWVHGDTLVDFKTKDGLGVVKRAGPTEQQWFQVALYAKALIDKGELPVDCWLSLVFIDRSGREKEPVAFSRRFDQALVEEAMRWLEDVIYAIQHGEEASRDKPRDWCFSACPYATACRGTDTDVEGVIDDPLVIEAKRVYLETAEILKAAEKDKKSALSVLKGRHGVIDGYVLRWVDIPATEIKPGYRAGYSRISLKPVDRAAAKRKKTTTEEAPHGGAATEEGKDE
jgi:hypothetical protein